MDGHCGYVAGQYRDGLLSDTWTDVTRCARGTFVGFAPVCTCGWQGDVQPGNPAGFQTCEELLIAEHLGGFDRARSPVLASVSTLRARGAARPPVSATFRTASA
jgi:hypothetical protein